MQHADLLRTRISSCSLYVVITQGESFFVFEWTLCFLVDRYSLTNSTHKASGLEGIGHCSASHKFKSMS